jgi:tRNA C32,U32 (ribose-2'-O)-methylase TrmJ
VCQNFGLTKNFAIVNPDPQALDTCDTHDMGGEKKHDIGVECVLKEDAKKFAVHASWMIEEAEKNITHHSHGLEDALKDCTFVVATTARSRENIPFLTPKELKEVVRKEAERGKVAVLFGNEARGLSNEELKYANVCVSIPTAGHPEEMTKKFRYTGGAEPRGNGAKVDATPVSLNLSHAAGILAYEIHDALANVNADVGFTSHLLNVEERKRLADDLSLARRSVDIFAPSKNASNGEEKDEEECMLEVLECLLHEKESKAIQTVLNAGPIASKNATPLFFLARRLKTLGDLNALDDIVKDFLNTKAAAPQLGSEKGISDAIRDGLGISLTNAETKRVFKYVCSKEFSRNHSGAPGNPPINFD